MALTDDMADERRLRTRRAPGLGTLELLLTPTPPPTPSAAEDARIAAALARRAGELAGQAGAAVGDYIGGIATRSFGPDAQPGQSALAKKAIEDGLTLIVPGRVVKGLLELGEGELPLTQKAPGLRPGLGLGEEARIAEEQAAIQRYYALRAAALSIARQALVEVGGAVALRSGGPSGFVELDPAAAAIAGGLQQQATVDEFARSNPADP